MLNLLVTIDRSLEASFALRTACLFGADVNIQPIYVFEPPSRDMAFGAGWARKSWERETSRQAEENIGELVQAERSQCPSIHDPVVLTGDSIQEPAEYFWSGDFDLLVVGAPFRGMGPMALCRRFGHIAHGIAVHTFLCSLPGTGSAGNGYRPERHFGTKVCFRR